MEAYVNYEIAKLLKEKGFDERTVYHYIIGQPTSLQHNIVYNKYCNSDAENIYVSPTHQMARAWLRDIHNIDIDIDAEVGMLGRKVYVPSISTYKPIENADTDMFRQFKRCLYYDNDRGVIPAIQYFHSYEEAVEASLKYVLENLI